MSFERTRRATKQLQEFIIDFDMFEVAFDGCDVGVVSSKGNPILNPWRIIDTDPLLAKSLAEHRCKTGKTAFYPDKLCHVLINSLYPETTSKHVPAMPTFLPGNNQCVHREKETSWD